MKVESQRIDHLGIVAGTIKDLGIIDLIDSRIPKDDRESISTGTAVAGMIMNGLGFSDRTLTLTPQFFQSKAMEKLFEDGVSPDHFNRYKLGRSLDNCYKYGCEALFTEISLAVCSKEGIDCRFSSEDSTTFTLTGEYYEDVDEHAIKVTYGHSKDHRPDLKQVTLEMMVSQDGGIPLISRSWSGNESDSKIFRERATALVEGFKKAESPRYLVADSKLYCKKTLEGPLREVPFITRIPSILKKEQDCISKALSLSTEHWTDLDKRNRCCTIDLEHYGLSQRWIVINSNDMKSRSRKAVEKTCQREKEKLEKEIARLRTREFSCKIDAENSLRVVCKKSKYHSVSIEKIHEKKVYASKGRPNKDAEYKLVYQVRGILSVNKSVIDEQVRQKSCYVVGTSVSKEELSTEAVVKAYKGQNGSVERGFRFLKDPLFFTSSLFVKKLERIEGLLMVMTLALLVYSIAERRMRAYLKTNRKTLPNQIKKEVSTPTLRWVFQMMEGIEFIKVDLGEVEKKTITGLTNVRLRIIQCFPPAVQKIYKSTE